MTVKTVNELVFSEYEVRQMNFHVGEDVWPVECIGSVEEANDVRKIIKKRRGVTYKNRAYGTGTGTLKCTVHMPYKLYAILHGMDADTTLTEGVYGYGYDSRHPEICMTEEIFDEDNVEKFKAYPRCIVSTGPARKVTNGEEEVAEVDLELNFMPDANNIGFYEALKDALTEELAAKWMNEFTPEMVHQTTVPSA